MPLDYGVRGRRRTLRGLWLRILPGAAVVGAILAVNSAYHRQLEMTQGWVGDRSPCPAISAAAYAAKGYASRERATTYEGVVLTRQFGHVMCKDIDTRGGAGFLTHPVCQFTSPTAVRVKVGGTEAFFEPGAGHLATVSVERGRAACAIGGKFTLFSDPTN
jgi:hypothetical protein